MGPTIALGLAGLLMAALLFHQLGRAVSDAPEQGTEEVARSRVWELKCSSCSAFLVNMLPLTAIKIVVTVWQMISQVCTIYV